MATLKIVSRKRHARPTSTKRLAAGIYPPSSMLVPQEIFQRMLLLERRRTERSGRPFLLVLISGADFKTSSSSPMVQSVSSALSSCIRETDVYGWYDHPNTLGLMMTEIGDVSSIAIESILERISIVLQGAVSPEVYCRLAMIVRVFPNEGEDQVFRMDCTRNSFVAHVDRGLKRTIDVACSLLALIVLSPLFLVIAILIKTTSAGPVFYSKKRLGQYGKEFSFHKFRTMTANNDPKVHLEYVSKLISGSAEAKENGGFYKLANDPRVTRIGRFLRQTSLDELPQFINVLLNDMSLVGPRPPLPYEYERYSIWHKRRVLELKPGITGLWQVEGRSRTTFEEMVRIDIRYARSRSLWLDLMIMLQTPAAMIFGRGAC